MSIVPILQNIEYLVHQLILGRIIVYPTESVYGLGCDPDNENAVHTLLSVKKRSWKKGLILVAANYVQIVRYIDDSHLNKIQLSCVFNNWQEANPITWLFPPSKNAPYWLTGHFSSLAVRIVNFEPIRKLCLAFGKPLISTSANLSGLSPACTVLDVYNQLGEDISIMQEYQLGGFSRPSKIQDVITGKLIRR